jgi:acyl carrier protein
MSTLTQATVEMTIVEIIEDLIQDWGLDLEDEIGGATMLVKDLEFASVDIIQLCVALEQHYKRKLGFQEMLMDNGSYVGDLAISRIAGFVEARLNNPEAPRA